MLIRSQPKRYVDDRQGPVDPGVGAGVDEMTKKREALMSHTGSFAPESSRWVALLLATAEVANGR